MSKLPELEITEDSRPIHEKIFGPRGGVFGMYESLLHHPELADKVSDLGTYFRYNSLLPDDIREVAILAIARAIGAPFVWEKHVQPALAGGVKQAEIDILLTNDLASEKLPDKYQWAWHIARHIAMQEEIPEQLQQSAIETYGLKEYVELVALCGFYRFIATIVFSFGVGKDQKNRF
jgi:alkylhydroperoxidase family enzyme